MLVGSLAGLVLLLTGAVALGVDMAGTEIDGAPAEEVVLGATEERPPPTAPAVTTTTQDPAAAFAAALAATAAANAATSTSTTTTTTAPPSTTTTASTVPPAPIAPASATTSGPGVSLALEVGPAGGARSLQGRLSARFENGAAVLRAVRVDFGDGTASTLDVVAWECNAADAPNPHEVALPAHTYGGPGTYDIIVTATTAACSPDDDDWGPETGSPVRLEIVTG
jgi:hypothetical protein